MKTVIQTPNSSVKSAITIDSNPSEKRDSFYFPGCRKDANCNCEICIASINATLDLMPKSIHGSSVTKFSSSRPVISRSPVSFNPSLADLSPKSCARMRTVPKRMRFEENVKKRKKDPRYGVFMVRILWGLILAFVVQYGLSWIVSGVQNPRLSQDIVKNLGEKSRDFEGLKRRFVFLKNDLEGLVGKEVSSCSCLDSLWKINQDGLLLNSRCVLYESMTEEVSIWGWPLQTAGLLAAEHSSRSFTIISGRVTEWSNEDAKYLVREGSKSSWTQRKWTSSVVQLEPNTWILEYKRSYLMDDAQVVSAVVEFLKFRLTREFMRMKKDFFWLYAFRSQNVDHTEGSVPFPT
ncbi:hypothetical protein CDL12_07481 [Handroanthus impetiginosus]|uniref:Uncharacterized protein n=1 Tax=Handroanthus impetiginosus TaxID=429701 RepID=A0A2G9HQM5_9LAMI|nr:hypothetical protein CDL12_07481 [Handroanthus impetiginosus]